MKLTHPAFVSNVQNAYRLAGVQDQNFSNTAINLQGVAATFESILDDLLLGISSAQLILSPNGSNSTTANATVNAVQIGEARYVYSVAAITLIILLIFAEEVISTQYWKKLSKFNYNDLASVVVATSKGGDAIGTQAAARDMYLHALPSRRTGAVGIRLDDKGGVVIVANAGTGLNARQRRPNYLRATSSANTEDVPLVQSSHASQFSRSTHDNFEDVLQRENP